MRTLLTTTLTFIIFFTSYAQNPMENWGNPSQEELTMAYCPVDPSADAAYLNNYGHYYFNRYYYFGSPELRTFYHYQVRMKIYTDEGKKFATVSIPYRGFDEYENVVEISGVTYNFENGKVVKTKLKAKNAQWTKNGKNMWNCTFTLPDVKPGSVIEYTYKIASLDFAKLRDWMFQKDIPVLKSNVVLTTPDFIQFTFFSNAPSEMLDVEQKDHMHYILFYNTNIYCNGYDLNMKARNVPAFKKEVLMPDSNRQIIKGEFLLNLVITRPPELYNFNERYLMPYLKPLFLTTTEDYYEPRDRIYIRNDIMAGYRIQEGMDWESFVKKLSKNPDFGKNMLKAFENKWLIDSFRKTDTGIKRMVAIYNYVKNNIKWNGQYRIFTNNSLEKTFEEKSGFSSDINLLLVNLLNRSGIQAKPVLISTRSFGNVYKEVGFFRKFNHVIVSVVLEGKVFLLDATDPLRPYDFLDIQDLNQEGLLVNILDHEWVALQNSVLSEIAQTEIYQISPEGSSTFEITTKFTGYPALQKRKVILNSSSDMKKLDIDNLHDISLPLIINKSEQSFLTEIHSDSLFITPLLNNSLVENLFTEEQRINPVDLKYERLMIRELNISIPEGYSLQSYPPNESYTMQGGFLSYSLNSEVEQNVLKMHFKFEVINAYIPSHFYSDLKLFLETIKELEQEKVVFIRRKG